MVAMTGPFPHAHHCRQADLNTHPISMSKRAAPHAYHRNFLSGFSKQLLRNLRRHGVWNIFSIRFNTVKQILCSCRSLLFLHRSDGRHRLDSLQTTCSFAFQTFAEGLGFILSTCLLPRSYRVVSMLVTSHQRSNNFGLDRNRMQEIFI
jgi:hypothetical protein